MRSSQRVTTAGASRRATGRWRRTFASDGLKHALRAIALAAVLLAGQPAWAQQAPATVRVGTFALAPFVMDQSGRVSGFSIDLWTEIAARLHLQSQYEDAPDVKALFQKLRMGQADIAVSGLFYSVERDREFDFSYPIMEAGLRVMVRGSGETVSVTPLRSLTGLLLSRNTLAWLGVALLFVVIAAHIVWVIERLQADEATREPYFPGIFRAMYWASTTLMAQGDQPPRKWIGRVLAVLWMFVGIVFVASYTAQLASTLTVQHIRGAINGPDDLADKRVATLKGGSAVAWLQAHGAQVVEYAQNRDVFGALNDGTVDAVVQGSAALDYYAAHEGKDLVKMVGPEFNPNDVGFVFPIGSPLRKRVNGALLSMREDGTYQRIYERWFGTP
jgi:polar amino acid transport system substrate-binding protein